MVAVVLASVVSPMGAVVLASVVPLSSVVAVVLIVFSLEAEVAVTVSVA